MRDDAGRVTVRHGPDGVGDLTYSYDALGQVTAASGPETFLYDANGAGELARTTHSGKPSDSTLFEVATGRVLRSWIGTVSGQQWGQLPHWYAYDAAGNRLRDSLPYTTLQGYGQHTRTSHDGAGRIIAMREDSIPAPGAGSPVLRHLWTYWYDAVGRRIVVADSTPTLAKPVTKLAYDGDHPALTQAAYWQQGGGIDGTPFTLHGFQTEAFLYDLGIDRPLYSATTTLGIGCGGAGSNGNLEYFYHGDERGSVKQVTFGSGGTYCNTGNYTYQGYGAGSTPTDGRPGFAGAPSDASGLVFLRNRSYDPNTGTFTQADPIGLAGGINLYGYAGNNPVAYTDPFGLCHGKDGKEVPREKCKEITEDQSTGLYKNAKLLMGDHQSAGTRYQSPAVDPNTDDCSNFCSTASQNAGIDSPRHDSRSMIYSGDYAFVPSGQQRTGDVLWQPRNDQGQGHVGVFTGTFDSQGRPLGIQMGVHSGASIQPWGSNGVFPGGSSLVYLRPLVPVP